LHLFWVRARPRPNVRIPGAGTACPCYWVRSKHHVLLGLACPRCGRRAKPAPPLGTASTYATVVHFSFLINSILILFWLIVWSSTLVTIIRNTKHQWHNPSCVCFRIELELNLSNLKDLMSLNQINFKIIF
jgi:hypothetical protein